MTGTHYPHPADLLRWEIANGAHREADLAKVVGSEARALEILNYSPMTDDEAEAIGKAWGLPPHLLRDHDGSKR